MPFDAAPGAPRDSRANPVVPFALEDDVERINQFAFYQLGQALQQLAALSGDVKPQVVAYKLVTARESLKRLLEGDPLPIRVSRVAAEQLAGTFDSIWKEHFTQIDAKGQTVWRWPQATDPEIPEWKMAFVRQSMATFETIFSAELRDTATYFVPRRGIYATEALVDNADESFPVPLRQYIPEKTKADWKAAGRCLAFNLLSASGFHVARAVEGTVERYWQKFSGAAPDRTLRSWNEYIVELEKIAAGKPTPAPADKTMTELRQMKDDYRNPIMHPRVVLTEADARMLFDNGESLIIAMADELCAIDKLAGGVQTSLAVVQGGATP